MAVSILVGRLLDLCNLCSLFLQNILLHIYKAAALKRCILFLLPLNLRDILWLLLPCVLFIPIISIAIISQCASFIVQWTMCWYHSCRVTWSTCGKERNFFFPKSEWNNELIPRYIFTETKSLCMLTVLIHDIYVWLSVKMTAKIVEFMLPYDKQVNTLFSYIRLLLLLLLLFIVN